MENPCGFFLLSATIKLAQNRRLSLVPRPIEDWTILVLDRVDFLLRELAKDARKGPTRTPWGNSETKGPEPDYPEELGFPRRAPAPATLFLVFLTPYLEFVFWVRTHRENRTNIGAPPPEQKF